MLYIDILYTVLFLFISLKSGLQFSFLSELSVDILCCYIVVQVQSAELSTPAQFDDVAGSVGSSCVQWSGGSGLLSGGATEG